MKKGPQIKSVKYGKVTRQSFEKIEEEYSLPYLLDIQKKPYKEFLERGIGDILQEFSPIVDYSGKAELHFIDYRIEDDAKYSILEAKKRRGSYTKSLKVKARLIINETGEVIDQEVFMGEIPIMSEEGFFVFNGVERVIMSQIIKSPNVYFSSEINKKGKSNVSAALHPMKGPRFSFEETNSGVLKLVINQKSKVDAGVFLKGCGMTSSEILSLFNNDKLIENTLLKEVPQTQEEALLEIGRKTRPTDIPMAEKVKEYIHDTFFSDTHHNFRRVGRYKYNKKLSLASRITDRIAAEKIEINKEAVINAGDIITKDIAEKIQQSGINTVLIKVDEENTHRVIGNARVDIESFIKCDKKSLGILEDVYYPLLQEILKNNKTKEEKIKAIKENAKELNTFHLTMEDILAVISYILEINHGIGEVDNIDHLANRRISTVGELMGNEFRKGMAKLRDIIRENLQSSDLEDNKTTPSNLISARPINKALRDFLANGQLSQITEDFNPAATLTTKRKISSVGPGGITAERAGAEVRDIHYSHYGRICTIETPEGPKIGLINGLAGYAKINKYGFIETPYRIVKDGVVTKEIVYMMADEEENCNIAQAIEPIDKDGKFINDRIIVRNKDSVIEVLAKNVHLMDVSPRQFVSTQTSLIPFLENDDTVRALTGSNMQRQAVPLLKAESPVVATGIEHQIAKDSGAMVIARNSGIVTYVDANTIKIKTNNRKTDTYDLIKYQKTNKETSFNQKPIVNKNDSVEAGDVIADSYSTENGELAIGKNLTVAFMNWEGYNYEDAVLVSDRLVKDDTFTSIVLKTDDISARTIKLGDEEITRDIPGVSEDMLKNLDENGIIRVGSEVKPGDYLVGKVTPKGETELTPEERLLRAIFGEKAREVRDNSLRVSHGDGGTVIDVHVFTRKNKDELEAGVNTLVKVFIAKKRKVTIGDKVAGRHGNKGVISKVVPQADMPYMENGETVDIVLNPLGVPSRMNIGQVLEVHLGLLAKQLNWKVATPSFNGATEEDIQQLLIENKMHEDGKMTLYDGRTGEKFENDVTVGLMYMIKLEHMAESKVHARSIGNYALVTRQPLGGKAMFGGQRLGEMEVWALEAYGAAHLLQEMLTIKSDDAYGRTKAYEAIVRGEEIQEPGIPESFRVLVNELKSIGLNVKILTESKEELAVNDMFGKDKSLEMIDEKEEELKDVSLDLEEDLEDISSEDGADQDEDIDDLFNDEELFDN